MTQPVRFDDSLSAFVHALVRARVPVDAIEAGLVIRDATGRLAFLSQTELGLDPATVCASLEAELPGYVRGGGRAFLGPTDVLADTFLGDPSRSAERVPIDAGAVVRVRLLDRRIVGSDWLSAPAPAWQSPGPARLVFASMKGGVGRSTALAVLASDLAASGRRVLVVDLDLEAPGLGAMLLRPDDRPKLGVLDWLVEGGLAGRGPELLEDIVAPSSLRFGTGLVDVAPVLGRTADVWPENVLAKLARAYLERPGPDERPMSLLQQIRALVDDLAARQRYDAVLVDARAGLNETTAACLLGLGADVLLFGVEGEQTFAANRYLLAHLRRFDRNPSDDWLLRMKLVHAKAPADPVAWKRFRDRAFDAFDEFFYRPAGLAEPTAEGSLGSTFGLDDEEAPHFAWHILSDSQYSLFDPLRDPRQLTEIAYRQTYDDFLRNARDRLGVEDA